MRAASQVIIDVAFEALIGPTHRLPAKSEGENLMAYFWTKKETINKNSLYSNIFRQLTIFTNELNVILDNSPSIFVSIFIAFTQLINASPVAAGQICWIQKVLSNADGVDIYFSSQRLVTVIDNKSIHRFIVNGLPQKNPINSKYYDVISFIHARVGNKIISNNGPEDNCSMEIILKGDKIGIEASSYVHLPGLNASDHSKFIPAE